MKNTLFYSILAIAFAALNMTGTAKAAIDDQAVIQQFREAIAANDTAKVKTLIDLKVNINAADASGRTALDYAQAAKATQIEMLLKLNGAKNGAGAASGTPTSIMGWIEKGRQMWKEIQSNIPPEVRERASGYFTQPSQPPR